MIRWFIANILLYDIRLGRITISMGILALNKEGSHTTWALAQARGMILTNRKYLRSQGEKKGWVIMSIGEAMLVPTWQCHLV